MKATILFFLILAGSARSETPAPPDPAVLIVAAKESVKKLETTAASWTTTISLSGGNELFVDVLHSPPSSRLIISIKQANVPPIELARIIQTPKTWYVTQDKRHSKHRPYEAEFDFPVISLAEALSQPRFLPPEDARKLTKFTGWEGDLAHFAIMPENPAVIRNMLAQYDEMVKANPAIANNPQTQKTIAGLRSALQNGQPLIIDSKHGMIAEYNTAKVTVKISDFRFIDSSPALDNEIARVAQMKENWQDFTSDPTAAKSEDLMMIGHCISWRPGQPSRDTECLLLNVATGQTRRVPFTGMAAIPGCFVHNRSAVVISGMEVDQGTLHLYEIDLKTGTNRQLGGKTLAVGQTFFPALSPDGRTLAAHFKNGQTKILDTQVALIDLASGEAKLIGEPFDGAFVNWLPDGKGLIMLKREYSDIKKPSLNTICKMDLTGALTPLFKGDYPLVVEGGIFFESSESKKWNICDLDGKNPRQVGDGLARHGFPTASPDGKKVIMMAFDPATGPRPEMIDLATGKSQSINVSGGLWTSPVWR